MFHVSFARSIETEFYLAVDPKLKAAECILGNDKKKCSICRCRLPVTWTIGFGIDILVDYGSMITGV